MARTNALWTIELSIAGAGESRADRAHKRAALGVKHLHAVIVVVGDKEATIVHHHAARTVEFAVGRATIDAAGADLTQQVARFAVELL